MEAKADFQVRSFVTVMLLVCVAPPAASRAVPSTLTSIARTSSETKYNHAPWDFSSLFGFTGPGEGSIFWNEDGCETIVTSSVMNVVQWWQFWRFGSTNSAKDEYMWMEIYRYTGTPGHMASVSLDYELSPWHFNMAADGRSQAVAHVQLYYGITDADVSTIDKLKAYNTAFPSESSSQAWDYTKKYYFGCFTWGEDLYTGTLPLGTMNEGDYIWLWGRHTASVEAQAYGPGVTGAAAVSEFSYAVKATEIAPPVPEPGAILLTAIGLATLAGHRRRLLAAN